MKNKNALTRYRLIDNLMTNKQRKPPTLKEIVDYISEKLNIPVSESSVQKDIYAMRYDSSLGFLAPIEFDRFARGYIYTDQEYSINKIPVSAEDLQGLELAVDILEQFKDIPAIKMFEDSINKLALAVKFNRESAMRSNIVMLDRPKRYVGIEFMADIVDAIRNKNIISISYQPFGKKEPKKHTVHPYFIKEYQNRMYLIGKDIHATKASKFLTFSFDRIKDAIKMHSTFDEEHFDKELYYSNTIGVSYSDNKPEKLILRFVPEQANYIQSQPIHTTQKIIKNTKNAFVISIEVIINYELMTLLNSFGEKLIVEKPIHLAEKMKKTAQTMLSNYKSVIPKN
ncbi:MAG: WYL domain-containing protein [Chitinophagaceae bacterium]